MGSGKTVVGRELAKIMGCRFVDTDELIEQEQGVAIKVISGDNLPQGARNISATLSMKCAKKLQQ